MLARVREYMSSLGGRREREHPVAVTASLVEQVQIYVAELERVLSGVESHSTVMRVFRQECVIALGEIEAHAQHHVDADLEVYVKVARNYVSALEYRVNGEDFADEALDLFKRWYERRRDQVYRGEP